MIKKFIYILFSVSILSCTDLDLGPEDADVDSVVFTNLAAYRSYLAKVYASYSLTGQDGPDGDADISIVSDEGFTSYIRAYWKAQELPTDEAIVAWTDAGVRDMNTHTWSSENQFVRVLYYRISYIIAYANDFLGQSEDSKLDARGISADARPEIATYRAEARFLRAMAYWHALDLFRNVPIVTAITTDLPFQATPTELFTFIEDELNEIEDLLIAPMANEYGRADRAALWMLQAKLYLNAKVYTGIERNDDVITAVNKVVGAGYSLHDNYDELFMADNHRLANSEIIFPIVSDGDRSQNWGNTTFLVHAAIGGDVMEPTDYGVGAGWAGLRTTSAMVSIFEDVVTPGDMDPRNFFFTAGQSLEITDVGEFEEGYAVPKFVNITSNGEAGVDLDFVDTDFPLFRLADAYLMYAEAVVRGGVGGDMSTAIGYINDIRFRAYGNNSGDITMGDLTEDFILDERVRELHWEGTRRVDLIRFGKYTSGYNWPWKGGVQEGMETISSHLEIFPIPASDLNVNENLDQNDKY